MASAANEWIFISYRRDDTTAEANWLADRLRRRFSGGAVFLDDSGIDWGVDFDKVLAHRVNAALVVLVLIGEKWQSQLEERAKLVAEAALTQDYVRMEVAAALARAGSQCMVIPLLCGNVRMPEAEVLKAAGFADLAGLSTKNGPSRFLLDPLNFAGQAGAAAGAMLARLSQRIDEAATQYSKAGDQSRGAAVRVLGQTASKLLADQDLHELNALWLRAQVEKDLLTEPVEAIRCFGQALEDWHQDRGRAPLPNNTGPKANQACRKLLGGLLSCAIDRIQALRLASTGAPVPAVSPGNAAAVRRLGTGNEPGFSNDLTRPKGAGDFVLYRQLHLEVGGPHPGTLAAQQTQVATRLHNLAIGGDDLGEKSPRLTDDQRLNLKPMLAQKAKGRDGAFILSALAVGPPLQDELQNLADDLGPGVTALAYTGVGDLEQNLCFGDQIALRVAVINCLDQIQEIR